MSSKALDASLCCSLIPSLCSLLVRVVCRDIRMCQQLIHICNFMVGSQLRSAPHMSFQLFPFASFTLLHLTKAGSLALLWWQNCESSCRSCWAANGANLCSDACVTASRPCWAHGTGPLLTLPLRLLALLSCSSLMLYTCTFRNLNALSPAEP